MRSFVWFILIVLIPAFLNAQSCGFQTTCVPPSDWANGSWQMFYGTQNHTGRQAMRGDFTVEKYIKWNYEPSSLRYSAKAPPAIGDINNDGQIEVVVSEGKVLYTLKGINGLPLWIDSTGACGTTSPAIGDIDGDRLIEVVVGCVDSNVYAIRGSDGSILWSYRTGHRKLSSPAIGDINGDGNIEVIVGSYDSTVYALRGTDGSLLWAFTTGNSIESSPAIGDINSDGQIEVVVGSNDGKVYALRGTDGSLIWYYTTGGYVNSSPAIGDINNDGNIEIVVGSWDSKIYALRGTNGSPLWSYTALAGVYSSPVIGDINNDGYVEVVVNSEDGIVYALRGTDRAPLWSYNIGGRFNFEPEYIVLADIDPSPGLEIIINNAFFINVLSSSGTLLWQEDSVPLPLKSFSIGDVDGDGCVEIVAVGGTYLYPMVTVIDASSNEGGCGTLVRARETKYSKPYTHVEIYTISGTMIYKGDYRDFKPTRKGIYFVVFGEGEVRKMIR